METNFNLGSLKIVHKPIEEYIDKIKVNIEENIHLLKDENKAVVDFTFIETLLKLQSSLKMIGINGVVKVLSLMNEVSTDLKEANFNKETSLEVWSLQKEIIIDLKNYIGQLVTGELDQPIKLFEKYKKLADLTKRDVSIKDLFFPKLDTSGLSKELQNELRVGHFINANTKKILLENITKSNAVISETTNQFISYLKEETNFTDTEVKNLIHGLSKKIYEVLDKVQEQKISKSYYIMFGIQKLMISAFSPIYNENFRALIGEHKKEVIENLNYMPQLLNLLISDINKLENGEKTGSLKINENIVKENTFFVMQTIKENKLLKNMPAFKNLKAYFNYDFYENQINNTSFKASVTQEDPKLFLEIEEKILLLIDEINIISAKNGSENIIFQYIDKFDNSINELKNILSEKKVTELFFNNFLNTLSRIVIELKEKKIQLSDDVKRELSISVLLLKNSVTTLFKDSVSENLKLDLETQFNIQLNRLNTLIESGSTQDLEKASIDIHNKDVDIKKALLNLYDEMNKEIINIEEVIDSTIRTEDVDQEEIETILPSFKLLSGIFKLNGSFVVSDILLEIQKIWTEVSENGLDSVNKTHLGHSIKWIGGVSLFIASLKNDNEIEAEEIEDKLITEFNQFNGNKTESSLLAIDFSNVNDSSDFEKKEESIETTILEKIDLPIAKEEIKKELPKQEPVVEKTEIKENIVISTNEDLPNNIDLLEVFLEELLEVREELKTNLEKLTNDLSNQALITNVRRNFHTIKGSGKMVGLNNLGEVAWIIEEELNTVLAKAGSVSSNLFNAMNVSQDFFEKWNVQLKNQNKITDNFNKIKEQLKEAINTQQKSITPTEPIQQKIKNVVMVNGKEIDKELYNLYEKESEDYYTYLVSIVNNGVNAIDNKFISYVEKLKSISREANFQYVANISNEIEKMAKVIIKNKENVSEDEYTFFQEMVKDILKFKQENNMHVINKYSNSIGLFEKNIRTMQIAKEKELIEQNFVQDGALAEQKIENEKPSSNSSQVVAPIDMEKIEEAVNKVISVKLEEILKSFDTLKKEISSINSIEKEQPKIEVNKEEIAKLVIENLNSSLSQQNQEIIKKIEQYDKNVEDNTSKIEENIQSIQKDMSSLKDQQEEIKKNNKESMDSIRRNLRNIGESLKKKSFESYQDILGNEVDQEFTSIGLDYDSLNLNKNFKNNDEIDLFNNLDIKNIFSESILSVNDEFDSEIYEISKEEIKDIFIKIEEVLESTTEDVLDIEKNNVLKRHLHTLKGSARMSGANRMGLISHRLESLLDYSENHNLSLFKMKSILDKEVDKLQFLEKNIERGLTKSEENWLDSLFGNVVRVEDEQEITPTINNEIQKEDKQYIRIVSNVLDSLINDAGEVRLSRTTLEGTLTNNKRLLGDLRTSSTKLGKMLKEIELQAETQISARKDALLEIGKEFDPLEFDRFTRLQELTRFMNETVIDIKDSIDYLERLYRNQENAVVQQSILTNNMLDFLMRIRLISIDTINERLYKVTRNTAKEVGKYVTLEIMGEKTEMDRLVLERIQSPLEHLVRNCIAHGIEDSQIRESIGKPAMGKLKIDISQDGNFITIKVSDDGAGINIAKVKKLGVERGLIKDEISYSDEEIIDLIFKSGFSTADNLSQISGRGVGMDIVKNEIFSLGGSIKTSSKEGEGTQFTIVLPVAVATTQAMLTEANGKLVAIPAILVDEVISMKQGQLNIAYEEGKINHNGKDYPLFYMGHLMGTMKPSYHPEVKFYNTLILISYLEQKIMVHVDRLETTDEILIKQMGPYFGKILGLLGATLLGDGRQGVVINPILLKDHFTKNIKENNLKMKKNTEENVRQSNLTIMVVDDSITVRRATAKLLEKYGYNVILCKDGEDGLEKLQISIPDIILSDIEMPNMDGFEFVKNVKNIEKYKKIPIIMITSRTAEKHKNFAYSLGVEGFLGKPYQEDDIIKHILNLTRK